MHDDLTITDQDGQEFQARLAEREPLRQARRVDVVYYLRWVDRIKIGTTSDLATRLTSIWHDEVLAVEPGDVTLERERHAEFADSKIERYTEWFEKSPALVRHINALRKQHGEPVEATARWKAAQEAAAA